MVNNKSYKSNRTFSDKFERQMKRILGDLFFMNDFYMDTKENTDLMLLSAANLNFACRIRKFQYFKRYPNDITIRCKSFHNQETEIHKIINGYGDYMFYGFCNLEETKIIDYKIIDLKKLRAEFIRSPTRRKELMNPKKNTDGTEFVTLHVPNNSDLVKFSNIF
jgi:hypothetical protein